MINTQAADRLETLAVNAMQSLANGLAEELDLEAHFIETADALGMAVTALREAAAREQEGKACID